MDTKNTVMGFSNEISLKGLKLHKHGNNLLLFNFLSLLVVENGALLHSLYF